MTAVCSMKHVFDKKLSTVYLLVFSEDKMADLPMEDLPIQYWNSDCFAFDAGFKSVEKQVCSGISLFLFISIPYLTKAYQTMIECTLWRHFNVVLKTCCNFMGRFLYIK